MASLTPAAAAMSLVLVPLNPLRANRSMATRSSCRRRSSPGIRGAVRGVRGGPSGALSGGAWGKGRGALVNEGLAESMARARAAPISKYPLLFDEAIRQRG